MGVMAVLGRIGGGFLKGLKFIVDISKAFGGKIFGGLFWFVNKFGIKKILMFLFIFMVLFPSISRSFEESSPSPFLIELGTNTIAGDYKIAETIHTLKEEPSADSLLNLWTLLQIPGYLVFIWIMYDLVNWIVPSLASNQSMQNSFFVFASFFGLLAVLEVIYFSYSGNPFQMPFQGLFFSEDAIILNLPLLLDILYNGIIGLPFGIGKLIEGFAMTEISPTGGNTSFLNVTNATP